MKTRSFAAVLIALFSVLFCALFIGYPSTVNADTGPKPSLTIQVKNAPKELYYLDLLVNYDGDYNNLEYTDENLDEQKLMLLQNYHLEEWYPALAHGTNIPLFGSLAGVQQDDMMIHTFSYFGTPDRYRVIIITPDNQIHVSKEMEKKSYQETVSLDYQTLDLTKESGTDPTEYEDMGLTRKAPLLDLLLQFCSTFFPTILIEGILLAAFGFSVQKNWKPFLLVNLITQTGITAALSYLLPRHGVFWSSFFLLPWIEAVILIVEILAYRKFLSGQSKRRAVLYGISANIASYLGSVAVMNFYSPWL